MSAHTIISEAFPLIIFGAAVVITFRVVSVLYFDAPSPAGSKTKEVFISFAFFTAKSMLKCSLTTTAGFICRHNLRIDILTLSKP